MRRLCLTAAILVLTPAIGAASLHTYLLEDHPDGNAAPPKYGLRFDDLFKGSGYGGVTTFSFSHADSFMRAEVDDVANTMRIFGRAIGGVDNGNGYGTEVKVRINFKYNDLDLSSFSFSDPNIVVPQGNGHGKITVLQEINNASGLLGNVYKFKPKANASGNMFNFVDGNHRGFDGLNGWGWVLPKKAEDSNGDPIDVYTSGTHDWLFTAQPQPNPGGSVPEPTAFAIWALLGLAATTARRRASAA